jgi:hypothetical protein
MTGRRSPAKEDTSVSLPTTVSRWSCKDGHLARIPTYSISGAYLAFFGVSAVLSHKIGTVALQEMI